MQPLGLQCSPTTPNGATSNSEARTSDGSEFKGHPTLFNERVFAVEGFS
jgi:hypothetical protein